VADERWTPTLEGYIDAASFVLRSSRESVRRLPRIALAESAIHAPFASFGADTAYSDLADQAAILAANGVAWKPPDVEVDAGMVERVATGNVGDDELVAWIRQRTLEKRDAE